MSEKAHFNTPSTTEQEAINLCICVEAVNDLVNRSLVNVIDVASYPGQAEIRFHDSIHQQLFLIRLLDFVKEKVDDDLTGITGTCLDLLNSACQTKSFEVENSALPLKDAVQCLQNWLAHRKNLSLWLPTLDIQAEIEVSRLDFLKISGNHSKHNLSRLTGVSREISSILKRHGYDIPVKHIPLALDDFREHLEDNYFSYYGTWLAELVNNIRWGIQIYLYATFCRVYKKDVDHDPLYTYVYPEEIKDILAKEWFWRLMNHIRQGPYLKKFHCAFYLKEESSLEWDRKRRK